MGTGLTLLKLCQGPAEQRSGGGDGGGWREFYFLGCEKKTAVKGPEEFDSPVFSRWLSWSLLWWIVGGVRPSPR
jgi:hypothetical protein